MTRKVAEELVMIAELALRPGQREAFLDYTLKNLELSRSAAGNIAFDILVDEARPDRVFFYEVWTSAEAQHAYMAWRIKRGDLTDLMSFLEATPRFTALKRVPG